MGCQMGRRQQILQIIVKLFQSAIMIEAVRFCLPAITTCIVCGLYIREAPTGHVSRNGEKNNRWTTVISYSPLDSLSDRVTKRPPLFQRKAQVLPPSVQSHIDRFKRANMTVTESTHDLDSQL